MSPLRNVNALLESTRFLLGTSLEEVDAIFEDELTSANPFVADIVEHTRRFRGKRLRPLLCLLVGRCFGSLTREHHVLAAVVEMIHTATLIHDDVLDDADVRRHVATVNVRWNNETSVLYGDFLFTHAFHLAASTGSAEACRIIGRATNRVCEGELMQVRNRGNLGLTEADYFSIIDGKTAELCAVACEIGARFAGAEPVLITAMDRYGRKLGQAFQIADDILDLVGLESSVGKTLGTDLQQQKLTLPLIRLLRHGEGTERDQLSAFLEEGTDEALRSVGQLVRESGVLDECLGTARELAGAARAELKMLPAGPAKEVLEELPQLAIERTC